MLSPEVTENPCAPIPSRHPIDQLIRDRLARDNVRASSLNLLLRLPVRRLGDGDEMTVRWTVNGPDWSSPTLPSTALPIESIEYDSRLNWVANGIENIEEGDPRFTEVNPDLAGSHPPLDLPSEPQARAPGARSCYWCHTPYEQVPCACAKSHMFWQKWSPV